MKNDKEQVSLVLVIIGGNVSEGARKDDIRTKSANQAYRDNFDATFGKKENVTLN